MSNSIIAYHGSDAKIDRFTIDKLKSGSGVNVFGIGIYFTTNINTAAKYGNIIHEVTINQANTMLEYNTLVSHENLILALKSLVASGKFDDGEAKEFIAHLKSGETVGYKDFMEFLEGHVGALGTINIVREFGINGLKVSDYDDDGGIIYSVINPDTITINKIVPNPKQESTLNHKLRITNSLRKLLIK